MAILNGKSTYRYKKESPQEKAKRLQREANSRALKSPSKSQSKVVVRNPAFDKLSEDQKKRNADFLRDGDSRGISHLIDVDVSSNRSPIKDNLSRGEKLRQYKEAFASSPYTQANIYRNTQNRKKELEILSDEEVKEKGLDPSRAHYRNPSVDPNKISSRNKGALDGYMKLHPDYKPKERSNDYYREKKVPQSRGAIKTGGMYVRSDNGDLVALDSKLVGEYKDTTAGILADRESRKQGFVREHLSGFSSDIEARKKVIADMEAALQKLQGDFDARDNKISWEESKSGKDYARRKEEAKAVGGNKAKYFSRNNRFIKSDWERGRKEIGGGGSNLWNRRLGKYLQANGKTMEDYNRNLSTIEDLKKKVEAETDASYKGWETYYRTDPREFAKQTKKLQEAINEKKAERDKLQGELDKFLKEESEKAENGFSDENKATFEKEDQEREEKLAKLRKDALEAHNELQNLSNAQEKIEEAKRGVVQEESAQDVFRKQLSRQQEKDLEDFEEKLTENRENLMDQYKNLAARAHTKEAGESYMAQKEALIMKAQQKLRDKFLAKQKDAQDDLEDRFANDPSFSEYLKLEKDMAEKKATAAKEGKPIKASDLVEEEKLAFIKKFAETDEGNPSTVVTRALEAYKNASKIEDDEDESAFESELELGRELDRRLALFADLKDGVKMDSSVKKDALDPIHALEWLLSEGANSTVAAGMLKNRGIDSKTIKEAQKGYWMDVLNMSEEEVEEMFDKQAEKAMKTKYDNGELTPEEEEAYIARIKRFKEGTSIARGTKASQKKADEEADAAGAEGTPYSRLRDEVIGLMRMGVLKASQVEDYLIEHKGKLKAYEVDAIKSYATDYDRAQGKEVAGENVGSFEYDEEIQREAEIEVSYLNSLKRLKEEFGIDSSELGFTPENPEEFAMKRQFEKLEDDKSRARFLMKLDKTNPRLAGILKTVLEEQAAAVSKKNPEYFKPTREDFLETKEEPKKKEKKKKAPKKEADQSDDDFLSQFD